MGKAAKRRVHLMRVQARDDEGRPKVVELVHDDERLLLKEDDAFYTFVFAGDTDPLHDQSKEQPGR